MLNTLLAKLIKGLVSLIALSMYYLLVHAFFFITVLSCLYLIMTGQTSDRPLYSSATHALATLKWVPLEKKAFSEKMYLCVCV